MWLRRADAISNTRRLFAFGRASLVGRDQDRSLPMEAPVYKDAYYSSLSPRGDENCTHFLENGNSGFCVVNKGKRLIRSTNGAVTDDAVLPLSPGETIELAGRTRRLHLFAWLSLAVQCAPHRSLTRSFVVGSSPAAQSARTRSPRWV